MVANQSPYPWRSHCRLFAVDFVSKGQGLRCPWISDVQSTVWNRLVVETPLVDPDLGFPVINDSRALQ